MISYLSQFWVLIILSRVSMASPLLMRGPLTLCMRTHARIPMRVGSSLIVLLHSCVLFIQVTLVALLSEIGLIFYPPLLNVDPARA